MELTAQDIERIPVRNLRVPRGEFVVVWTAAERRMEQDNDWYTAGVVATCRWLANVTVRSSTMSWHKAPAPVSRRRIGAYEELIDAELLEAERWLSRRPVPQWMRHQPGWVEAIAATLAWAWRHTAGPPIAVDQVAAG